MTITAGVIMSDRLYYGPTAKSLHWIIVALLLAQYLIGWFMPDIHRGPPGAPMVFHISVGMTILIVTALRIVWRLTHPVPPDPSLSSWQRLVSQGLHWLLYVLVFAATITGWLFVSLRGWSVSFFYVIPLPMLTSANAATIRLVDGWHQAAEWALLVAVGLHVLAALAHVFIYRDRILQRMLPG